MPAVADEDDERLQLEDLLPSPDAGPEALYARRVLLEELEVAIDELPEEQRDVFVAHELEGRSFKEMAAETGVSVNTLLSRKHYAVLHLRERLQAHLRRVHETVRTDMRDEKMDLHRSAGDSSGCCCSSSSAARSCSSCGTGCCRRSSACAEITFWQALGLLALCRILFGGLGSTERGSAQNPSPGRVSHGGPRGRALGTDDARRARTVPAGPDHTRRVSEGRTCGQWLLEVLLGTRNRAGPCRSVDVPPAPGAMPEFLDRARLNRF